MCSGRILVRHHINQAMVVLDSLRQLVVECCSTVVLLHPLR